jgi:hypothetical protein
MMRHMDEGLPIAYQVLERHVPVYSSDQVTVGTVDHVVAAYDKDIFHGIVIDTREGKRLVYADQIDSLHERGVDLLIDASAAQDLAVPNGGTEAWRVNEPGAKPSEWRHIWGRFTPNGDRSGWNRIE